MAGRPSIYEESYVTRTQEYLDSCVDNLEKKEVRLPSIEGLAVYLNLSRNTIYEWCKEHSEFSDIIEVLKAKQAEKLLNNGLSGTYNPTISKVLLTKHGYREGQDITTNDEKITSGVIVLPQKNADPLETTEKAD